MEFKIRQAQQGDAAEIVRYDRHIGAKQLASCIQQGQVYCLCLADKIIGVMRYSLFWQSIPFLDLIFIGPADRGKGYGRRAMVYWEMQMKSFGYSDVMTSTQADEEAQIFYAKIGYSRAGSFLPPGQEVEEIMLKKKL